MLMQHMYQPWSTNDRIHFISSRDLIDLLILTSLALHHCLGVLAPSLAQVSRHAVYRFKASDLPFTLAIGSSSQVLSWSSPPNHAILCDVSCNELLHHICEPCNISKPFSPLWHVLLTQVYLWTNLLCISHKHIFSLPRLSLNYHNQTRDLSSPSRVDTRGWSPQA
jgi:hypothetical protein